MQNISSLCGENMSDIFTLFNPTHLLGCGVRNIKCLWWESYVVMGFCWHACCLSRNPRNSDCFDYSSRLVHEIPFVLLADNHRPAGLWISRHNAPKLVLLPGPPGDTKRSPDPGRPWKGAGRRQYRALARWLVARPVRFHAFSEASELTGRRGTNSTAAERKVGSVSLPAFFRFGWIREMRTRPSQFNKALTRTKRRGPSEGQVIVLFTKPGIAGT